MRKGTDTGRKRCASRRVAPSGNRFLPLLIGLVPPARYIASNRYYLACNARLNAERTCAYSVRLSAWPRPRFLINFFDKYLSKPAGQRAAQICGEIHRLGIVQSFFFSFSSLSFAYTCIHDDPSGSHRSHKPQTAVEGPFHLHCKSLLLVFVWSLPLLILEC